MQQLLQEISEKAIKLADFEYSATIINNRWLGRDGATVETIQQLESKLGLELPEDYRQFLLITDGFASPSATEPSFLQAAQVDHLHKLDQDIVDAYYLEGLEETAQALKAAILVGGLHEDQYFLLIPPVANHDSWQYWKFANWIPGEEEYGSIEAYFQDLSSFIDDLYE